MFDLSINIAFASSLSRNWRHNKLNANELYEKRVNRLARVGISKQFLAQVTDPQAFVNPS
jgi:hypothetical protein